MNKILNGKDIILSKRFLNYSVIGKRDALLGNLAVSALVDEFTNRLEVRLPISNVGFNQTEHLLDGLGNLDKNTVVDL
jgi:hypothetical protein